MSGSPRRNRRGACQLYTAVLGSGFVPPPQNDDCWSALPLPVNAVVTGSNIGATQDGASVCGVDPSSADVWYTVTPECTGVLMLDTCDSGFDTVLSIYSGGCGQLSLITCNDDAGANGPCPSTFQSYLTAAVTSGQTYHVRVAGYHDASGGIHLRASFAGPSNDSCASPQPVTPGVS